ncbi:extradiol ring-cleavage dioxygenase [Desertimonas flava]|uniref:DODA-type extradiol aromatic ring-opening family dioxygenase n=1 Tax=Desertimonas flava TaxID=2064846 RepID=UPI000E3551A9|nr:extradiol ring-cleavage dioxygenase [Desertimonas flava]
MAHLVGAGASSHSPLLLANPSLWRERAHQDRSNTQLYDSSGRLRTYDELEAEAGDRFAAELSDDVWAARFEACQQGIRRVGQTLRDLELDAVIVVGDDQAELFDESNQPALALYWGETWETAELPFHGSDFFDAVKAGYAMDAVHRFQGAGDLARSILASLCDAGFDATSVASQPPGKGFGHAFGYVGERLLGTRELPIVPLLLNTYFPPNQPTPRRCVQLGDALRNAIEAAPGDARVAIVASGGLSHFVVDEALDERVLDGVRTGKTEDLAEIPTALLRAGSSEIRNWITVVAAMQNGASWHDYAPCYRSPAGTGCGMGFAVWT